MILAGEQSRDEAEHDGNAYAHEYPLAKATMPLLRTNPARELSPVC